MRRLESGTSEVGAEGWGALPLSSRRLRMTCWSKTWKGIQKDPVKLVKLGNNGGCESGWCSCGVTWAWFSSSSAGPGCEAALKEEHMSEVGQTLALVD